MPEFFIYIWILALVHIFLTWFFSIRRGLQARKRLLLPAKEISVNRTPVSILVPAWKEKGTIEHCIEALKKIDYPEWEALILAGGPDSTYDTSLRAVAGDSHFRVLERGPEPKNVAIMQGVQAAKYNILVLLDADSLVFPDWLSCLVEPIAAGAAASFGMHYPLKETWISLAERMDLIHAYYIIGSPMAQGCSSQAIRSEVLNRIGPLPAKAFSWEDWDIDIRLLEAGETNAFVSSARLLTERPVTFKDFWQNAVRSYRSHLAGLWYYRARLLHNPVWGFYEILFYLVSSAVTLAVMAGLLLVLLRPDFWVSILNLAILGAVWIGGRRVALAAEIAAFMNNSAWLRRGWSLLVLLPVQFAAAVVALLVVWRQPSFDYKGQRQTSAVQG